MVSKERVGHIVDCDALPDRFPTHKHDPAFWEALGRAVATFGFLEDALTKAIFAVTATTHYREEEIGEAYRVWLSTLERALVDPLGNLIDVYGKAVRNNSNATVENFNDLIDDLRDASQIRNVICHGSWGLPDSTGATVPFFVNKKKERFSIPIDTSYLDQLQRRTVHLACSVINTVTHMGWQFPGSSGPGEVILSVRK
jgi:hypothetical protein